MADPGQGHLAVGELGKFGPDVLAGAGRQERLPDHFVKKGARIEVFAGGQILEGTGQGLAAAAGFALGKPNSSLSITYYYNQIIKIQPRRRRGYRRDHSANGAIYGGGAQKVQTHQNSGATTPKASSISLD